ncbi:HAUS augmin-like complex subunit 6 N-terminus-domain-containing protein [Chytriomyces sp. MP71]|nr:HAUS augmin-like complex subunit 6 N-terminus-domain-containing protein [Chytriomyces sp. MP71]
MLSSASPVSGNAEKRVRVRKVTVKSTGSEKWMRSTANDTQTAVLSALALLDFDACALPPPTTLEQLFGRGGGGGGAHPKVFECVAWFLVNQVGNGSGCVQVLKQAWPVLDRAHAREFRNGFAKALELLKKSGAFPQSLLIRRSCFDDCRGERFEQIMLALANLAVSTVMKREYADFIEPVPIKLLEKTSYTTEDYLSFMDKLPAKFESDVKEWDSQTKEWLDYGAELSDNFTKVLIEMDQLSKQRTELEEGAPLLDGVHYADFKSLRRVHQSKLETVRRFWADTLDWMDANAENIEIIDSVLENRANQHILDGTEARLEIPQDLSEHFRSRMQRDRIAPYAEDGALNLTSVAKLWQYSVEHVGMIFNAAGLYDDAVLNETYSTITKELEMATGIQESSIEVRKRLLAEKEHLLASIASLKMERKSRQDITSDSTTSALKKALNQPSLMLAPVTPKLHIRDRLKKGGKVRLSTLR